MSTHSRVTPAISRLLTLAMLAGVCLATAAPPARAATVVRGSFIGSAYATFANAKAGQVATTLGRSA